ncbi:hypothetical protein [Labrys miyagiensis]|uniref:hypothetical protein n=1 Tax=Labrys miyagiensis TaxID=346912 RepID=UPI0024E1662E|nr:hypothetical protein [Labrys miyagiensis]
MLKSTIWMFLTIAILKRSGQLIFGGDFLEIDAAIPSQARKLAGLFLRVSSKLARAERGCLIFLSQSAPLGGPTAIQICFQGESTASPSHSAN